jgi:hypothetical protein
MKTEDEIAVLRAMLAELREEFDSFQKEYDDLFEVVMDLASKESEGLSFIIMEYSSIDNPDEESEPTRDTDSSSQYSTESK